MNRNMFSVSYKMTCKIDMWHNLYSMCPSIIPWRYREKVEVKFHTFLVSTQDGCEWSESCCSCFTQIKRYLGNEMKMIGLILKSVMW